MPADGMTELGSDPTEGEPSAVPGVDPDALARWLRPRVGLDATAPLEIELIAGGRSNLTYSLRSGARTWVLRRPPLGRRLPTAHSMSREHRVLRALAPTVVPVPPVVTTCDDESVIGAPFYVMDHVPGRVLRAPEDVDLSPAECRGAAITLVRTLAQLHQIDYLPIGLGSLGRPEGYLTRQMQRWRQQLDASRVRDLPLLDALGDRLAAALPDSADAAILHGDYRIDNVLLAAGDPTRVAAVLDWEMATLGDPLCDLGMLLMYWREAGERCATPVHAITAVTGFPTRAEIVEVYAQETAAGLDELAFYIAFSHFKLAVIVEGIHARHLDGLTVGDGFDQMGAITPVLAEQGMEALG